MSTTEKQYPSLSVEHWKEIEQQDRQNFYGCAMHFFASNDMLEVIQVLQEAKSEDKQKQDKIDRAAAGLNSFWFRHHCHKQNLSDISAKQLQHV
jgi:hypothetical protein